MKIGISSLLFNLQEGLDLCENIKDINHIEIGLDNLQDCIKLLNYKDRIENLGLSVGIHLPMELNPCENIDYMRKQWVKFIKEMDDLLIDFDIKYYNLHLGYVISNRLKNNRNKYLDNSVEFLKGINIRDNIKISIENTYSKYGDLSNIGNTCYDFEYILNKIDTPNICFCYDTGHYLINKDNYIERLSDKIQIIHLSDNDGINDIHVGIGNGVLEISHIKKVLKLKAEYLILEIDYNHIKDTMDTINLITKEV
ncbi:sugar phosphate isomerase/epimerase [Romboutsia weinsteinii]|uniref:Sugar phosphate isomerase/epimerase n=1 Tax=Romboutsia weinsteinii TaxID=2020949 RepID=A0A371J075_9FIRM|nr:sugar phosphate isomerase/epimerase [Romboutsia weinsteinii]RDY26066.1 sugar phosphate isomerase/epimerase [Romboutsia weinsteinii]